MINLASDVVFRDLHLADTMEANGARPHALVTEAGYDGADLLWDLSGSGNAWSQPGASRLPYALPDRDWSGFRRRANVRLWRLLAALVG